MDPLYNGFNLTHYNPDIILVTATYLMGIMGQINLRQFPDSEGLETSMNNDLLDQVTALKWVKANIAGFGGDTNCLSFVGASCSERGHEVCTYFNVENTFILTYK